jgi:hypothetical protein
VDSAAVAWVEHVLMRRSDAVMPKTAKQRYTFVPNWQISFLGGLTNEKEGNSET